MSSAPLFPDRGRCTSLTDFPCEAPGGCGGAFCWRTTPLPPTIETVEITDRTPIPWTTKINPVWWLQGPDGWEVPTVNNGEPYLPDVKNVWLRRLYWFGLRNPLMNFVGFVVGVEDQNYTVRGTAPVLRTTGRDCDPQQMGWRWAVIRAGWRWLPFVSYWNGTVEFYAGWRPASGGLGLKLVFPGRA